MVVVGNEMKNGETQESPQIGKEVVVDSDKGKELVKCELNTKAVAEEKKYQNRYPAPLATYMEIVQDPKLFMDTLGKVHMTMGTKFMIPVIGGKELDLHRLFVEVTSRGGIEKVIADRRWREVTAAFSFPSTATNASFVLRKYYMSLLNHYEQIYFFRSQGWNSPPTALLTPPSATSVPSERSVEPIQQQSSVVGTQKRKANGEPAPSTPSGSLRTVAGVIDGKFEHGYFVTVTVGSQRLRGVLFHAVENTAGQALDISGTADNSDVIVRRRRRRKKLSKRDPTHPKPNRSGYNFFFAEQHARLKPLHPGRDREISRMIGELWNKLTEPEKAVYQERGVKDKERYISEMAVYREKMQTGMVIRDAVPIQQRPAEPVRITEDMESKMEIDEGDVLEVNEEEDGSSTDDSSGTEDKKSDEESELENSEIGGAATESTDLVADPSIEGDGFELRPRDNLQAEADKPSSSEDAESKKVEQSTTEQQ